MRALPDSGSQASFITEHKALSLKLMIQKSHVLINTQGATQVQSPKGLIVAEINGLICVNLHKIPRITGCMPSHHVDVSQMRHIPNVNLADPTFNLPGKIDVVLGADILEEILFESEIKDHGLALRDSLFGWVVSGPAEIEGEIAMAHVSAVTLNASIDLSIGKFWELESVIEKKHLTKEEQQCDEHVNSTTIRKDDGRFVVEMPFKSGNFRLVQSKGLAMRRFLNLELKLLRDPALHKKYSLFIKEFIDLGHLERVPAKELDNPDHFYLPHHCVTNESSTSTKLGVVFDASAKTTSGLSRNDCLMVGPKIQEDLFNILIPFRFFKKAMSADVAKKYRQVELDTKDKDYLRIPWRFDSDAPIETHRMTRVTYGVASSSYHSVRSLVEYAKFGDTPPEVSTALRRDFYVDDILTGADSVETARKLQIRLIATLKKAQLDLQKWTCSVPSLVLELPEEYQETGEAFEFMDTNHSIKTLGIVWKPLLDKFNFTVSHVESDVNGGQFTKRQVLSDVAKVFDPLGWLEPVTLQLKHLLHITWKAELIGTRIYLKEFLLLT